METEKISKGSKQEERETGQANITDSIWKREHKSQPAVSLPAPSMKTVLIPQL
jgi:hypothetical protein